jgi:uncharacterized small protein (DUF1192 family)
VTTPDIDQIRKRWAIRRELSCERGHWKSGIDRKACEDTDFLLAAVDERDKRIAELEAELADFRAEQEADRKWAALCRQSDVRCRDCDLRYAERQQYSCGIPGNPHRYNEGELAAALRGDAS